MNDSQVGKYFAGAGQATNGGPYAEATMSGSIGHARKEWQPAMQDRVISKVLASEEILKQLAGQIGQLQHIATRLRALNARLIGPPQEINGTRDSDCQGGGGFIAEAARALAEQTRLMQNIVDQISVIEQVI